MEKWKKDKQEWEDKGFLGRAVDDVKKFFGSNDDDKVKSSSSSPDPYESVGATNVAKKVLNEWQGEAVDGIKKASSTIDGAVRQVHEPYNIMRNVADSALDGNTKDLKQQATNIGKGKLIDEVKEKAKEVAPKPIKKAWEAINVYNTGKETIEELGNAIPKDE